jgi:hypothetical protein
VGDAGGLLEVGGNAGGAEVDALGAAFAEAVRTSAVACIADLSKVIHYFSCFQHLVLPPIHMPLPLRGNFPASTVPSHYYTHT